MNDLLRDLRFAVRTLVRSPGFTATAVMSLGLGLALAISALAVVNAYLVRDFPYPAADRMYHLIFGTAGQEPRGVSGIDWQRFSDVIDMADNSSVGRFFLGGEYTDEVRGLQVAEQALEGLGVTAVTGRSLEAADFRPGAERAALISPAMWRRHFGADPAILGRSFRASLNDQTEASATYRVVGILPDGFRYARDYARAIDLVTQLQIVQRPYMVRLRAGVPPGAVEQRITEAVRSAASFIPPGWPGVKLESLRDRYITDMRPVLYAIAGAAALVLVVVCMNLAVLLLLRAMRRQREMGVRIALGAGRIHIARMLVAETSVIALAAVVGGVGLASVALRFLAPVAEAQLGRPVPGGTAAIAIDARLLLAIVAAGVAIAFVLSFVPLLTRRPVRLTESLKGEGRSGTDGPTLRRWRTVFVALEIAGSIALLVGSGLMIRTAFNMLQTDLGFRTGQVVRARVALPGRTYPDGPSQLAFYDQLAERLASSADAPVGYTNWPSFFEPIRHPLDTDAGRLEGPGVAVVAANNGYFATLGIPIVKGRGFTRADRLGGEPVAIVSETLASRLWPGGAALGQRLRTAEQTPVQSPIGSWRTVIGVARDIRQTPRDQDLQDVYLPFEQVPGQYTPVFIRSSRPASFWLPHLRSVVGQIDPGVLVGNEVHTLDDEAREFTATSRFLTWALSGCAIFALLLAMLGIYGVTAYGVHQRQREVAIRMALGAAPGTVVRMFLREGATVLAAGVAAGLLATIAIVRLVEQQIFGIEPFDISTVFGVCLLTAAAMLAATWWPARRAAGASPAAALGDQ